jgi:DNA-binding CsgD family transcriptional regulator
VSTLAASEWERLFRFVSQAESMGGTEPFTGELLVELSRLVDCDNVNYAELDRVRRRTLLYVARPGDPDDAGEGDEDWTWDVLDEHPVCRRHQHGDFRTLKVSDFLTQRDLHRTRLYEDWFKPQGFEYELDVAIPSPHWHTRTFVIDRGAGRDFTERDRLVLDLLKPHLERLWWQARTRRLLGSALAVLERASADERRGVILLGPGLGIEFGSAPALRLLREFFPGHHGSRLPAAVGEWLRSEASRPFFQHTDDRRLTVDRDGDALLLEESHDGALLTAREREVLSWVARGRTNSEIAAHLWISPATVGKHLENVYAKLGVRTRTAAMARFLGLLDVEGDDATYGVG